MINLDSSISTPWLVFAISGQWCILGLLLTLIFATHLPARKNPFFVNFIVVIFILSIPPLFLVYAGKQHQASTGLCFFQNALMDGTAAMFACAHFVLVFDTWSELRSISLHRPHLSRKPLVKYILILTPYVVMCIWLTASFVASSHSGAALYNGFVYCIASSPAYNPIRTAVGLFASLSGFLGLFFEVWVCWMIYRYPAKAQKDPLVWKTNIQFATRVLIYSFLIVLATALSIANQVFGINSPQLKAGYMMLNSMISLTIFIIFGTQKSILQVWKFWDRRRSPDSVEELELQPQGYPMLDWADIPARKPTQFIGERLDYEEKGQRL